MQLEQIKLAIAEAKRFIAAAEHLLSVKAHLTAYHYQLPKESGTLRRASMDLTRQLAVMRKP